MGCCTVISPRRVCQFSSTSGQEYVNTPEGPLDATNYQEHFDHSNKCKAAIPPELSFEHIVGTKAAAVRRIP